MTADTLGGVWTYALALSRALCGCGNEVHLASMGRFPTPAQQAQARLIEGLVVHSSAFRLCWMENPWADIARASRWLLRLAREIAPDLIHLNDFGHAALPWRVPTLLVGHSCVMSWWQAVHASEAPAHWGDYRRLVRRGIRSADVIIAPTAAMGAALDRHHGPIADLRVIPNGLAAPTRAPSCKKDQILCAGRLWDEAKNLAAIAAVANTLPWPVVVAGEGAPHPPPSNLFLTGPLEPATLARYYRSASIFALPARYEPFGLAALEAGLNGCALVLGDIPSLREVWGDAALYVPPNDTARLKASLLRLIAEPDTRRRLGQQAAERARGFSLERMRDAYLDVYTQLLAGPARLRLA